MRVALTDLNTNVPFTPKVGESTLTTYPDKSGVPVQLKPVPSNIPLAPSPIAITEASVAGRDAWNSVPFGNDAASPADVTTVGELRNGKLDEVAVKNETATVDLPSSPTTSKYHKSKAELLIGRTFGASSPLDVETNCAWLSPRLRDCGITVTFNGTE